MLQIASIAAGGALGSVLRYLMQAGVHRATGADFPVGTLAVNVLGCLAIGFLAAAFASPWPVREEYRLGVITGLLGGFTTFSAFGWETFALANNGRGAAAMANVLLSCFLGLAAVWVGYLAAGRWFHA